MTEKLSSALKNTQTETFDALCDSFDTRTAMARLSSLITDYNSIDKASIANETTMAIAKWITSMVNTFGLNGEASPESTIVGWSGIDIPEVAKPYIAVISKTRDELRSKARSSKGIDAQDVNEMNVKMPEVKDGEDKASAPYRETLQNFKIALASTRESSNLPKEILALCDQMRDVQLWNHGIYLEDRDNEPALIRPVTRELRAARAEKEDRERQKRVAKEERDRQAAAKADKGKLSHLEMFRTTEYSAWNEEGLPTKDSQGADVTKSREKKLKKDWAAQKKLHEAWVKASGATNGN